MNPECTNPPGLTFGSVCSGIEAASVAWHPLGWRAAFLSEIAPFPRALLAHHYPKVPLHGDFTTITAGTYRPIDVLVGGTPCQSFSLAGLRAGMADDRGNLALEYLRLAGRTYPRWLVWENVPGVLSSVSHHAPDPCDPPVDLAEGGEWVSTDQYDSEESHAFGCFLAGLAKLGYGFAYRRFDAQYFGLAQHRPRVFVVGHLGDWRGAGAVLFERESLRRDDAPRRSPRHGDTGGLPGRASLGGDTGPAGGLIAFGGNNTTGPRAIATAVTASRTASGRQDFESETFICPGLRDDGIARALRADGFDASEDGTGRGTPLVIVPGARRGVRRLTPRECERLQGFPDDYTLVPYRGGLAADGPRYHALGNSMPVPVMRWIGERIAIVDASWPVHART